MISRLKHIFRLSFQVYWQKKWRLISVAIVLSLGIAAIFMLLSIGNTVRLEIIRRFQAEGADLFTVLKRPGESRKVAPNQTNILSLDFIDWFHQDNNPILELAPEKKLNLTVQYQTVEFSALIVGSTEDYAKVNELKLRAGRFLTPYDAGLSRCVIGQRVARRLQREPAELLGETLHLGPLAFQIVGILRPSRGFQSEYSINESILIPFRTMVQFTNDSEINKISIKTDPKYSIGELNDFIHAKLTLFLGDASNYEVTNQQVFIETIRNQTGQLSLYLGIAGCFLFLAGTFLFIQMMAWSVRERRKIFNLYRIFGVPVHFIHWQIFLETIGIGVMIGGIGILVGLWGMQLITNTFDWVLSIALPAYFIAWGSIFLLTPLIGYFSILQYDQTRLNMMLQMEP